MKKGLNIDASCPLCNENSETDEHLFMHCNATKAVWFASPLGIHVLENADLKAWVLKWLTCKEQLGSQIFCSTLWKLWQERNQVVFQQKPLNPMKVAKCAADFVTEFNQANPKRQSTRRLQQHQDRSIVDTDVCIAQVDAGCFSDGYTTWGLCV